jgi:hypothetical protein
MDLPIPDETPKKMVIQAKARYEGYTEVGKDSFSIAIQDMKPKATVSARVFFANRTGSENYEIGKVYDAVLQYGSETKGSPTKYETLVAK